MNLPTFKHVLFKPWVGKDFDSDGGMFHMRVLIMGQSHYEWKDGPKDQSIWTINCVEAILNGNGYEYFWPQIEKTVMGNKIDRGEQACFWQSVAFYNYIQECVGDGPGIPPTWEMYEKSQPAFREILEALRPHVVLVFSTKIYDNLPPEDKVGEAFPVIGDCINMETCYYRLSNGNHVHVCRIRHPRNGLSPSRWHPAVMRAISQAQLSARL